MCRVSTVVRDDSVWLYTMAELGFDTEGRTWMQQVQKGQQAEVELLRPACTLSALDVDKLSTGVHNPWPLEVVTKIFLEAQSNGPERL